MKTLSVGERLEYARATVAVLRTLKITNRKIRYIDLACAIGLMSDVDVWEPRLRQQVENILQLAAAAERQKGGGKDSKNAALEFERIVKGKDGEPGPGIQKESRITRT
jgi:hypothetical protein